MLEVLAVVAAVATGVAGLIYLFGKVRRGFRAFEVLAGIVDKELTPNGGGSLHDKITKTHAEVGQLRTDFNAHLTVAEDDRDRLAAVERYLGLGA